MLSAHSMTGATDTPADGADRALKATRRASDKALDGLSERMGSAREAALERVITQAEALARRGLDAMRDGSHQVRDKALEMSDRTVVYIKDEPVKSMLFAAAAGAALVLLASLVSGVMRRD